MGCPVALNSAIVQCVSQSNTHTLTKQTTPGEYSRAGCLFSLCLNVGSIGVERERATNDLDRGSYGYLIYWFMTLWTQ